MIIQLLISYRLHWLPVKERIEFKMLLYVFKDYRYHDFPNTEFSYFLTIDTRQ